MNVAWKFSFWSFLTSCNYVQQSLQKGSSSDFSLQNLGGNEPINRWVLRYLMTSLENRVLETSELWWASWFYLNKFIFPSEWDEIMKAYDFAVSTCDEMLEGII